MKLATKISVTVFGLTGLALLSSLVGFVSARRYERTLQRLVVENVESVRAAEELEISLLEQRGYVSSYLLDGGNRRWLEELTSKKNSFDQWLAKAHETAHTDKERAVLSRLEIVYQAYEAKRTDVIALYDGGQPEQAKQVLLHDVVDCYDEAYELCEQFIATNAAFVDQATANGREDIDRLTVLVTTTIVVTLVLGSVLLWLFYRGVFLPIRRLTMEARVLSGAPQGPSEPDGDDLRSVGHVFQLLMADVTETRSHLVRSQMQLSHAEKLASVGKLAACVAHEIRNPLTSLKMWMFTLRRALSDHKELQANVDLMAEETTRLESIVREFLEFSRPPQLKLERQHVNHILEKTVDLLRHRLVESRAEILLEYQTDLPDIFVDAEQLRQVFINLIHNSIDAMEEGGQIGISCSVAERGGKKMVVAHVTDSGSGMPTEAQDRIFEPFFTTKDSGTGLGLCIAASIMTHHNGALILEASGQRGTRFAIWIPAFVNPHSLKVA
ncbi:MAG: MCP four helix bundle domain-containing protein [Planctomycetales bacterium]|nr:MCP four helix bundle domain-containing protein [Planctomycetales bacterium]